MLNHLFLGIFVQQYFAMTYDQVLSYLFTQVPMFHREGASAYKPGLEVISALCAALDHPQKKYPSIHVAGTNGKGSTSSMLSSVLQCSGKKVGLFTSPHIHDFRERMRVNQQMPSQAWVVDFVVQNKPHFDRLQPTFFEMTTAMAFFYFAQCEVDVAVIEVGMGGRLDATNLLVPMLSVITNIGLDHTDFLGHTLAEIAMEKAGIIKPGVPVVVGESDAEVGEVFERRSLEMRAPLVYADQQAPAGHWDGALGGAYQQKNKCTVYAAVCELRKLTEWALDDSLVRRGFLEVIQRTGLWGRWQQLGNRPRVVCDTGHNAHGMQYVVQQLEKERGSGALIVVFGMVKDKDTDSVLRLLPTDAYYIFTQARIPRAMPKEDLACRAAAFGLTGEVASDVPQALVIAQKRARPEDLIFIGGSTFIVSEIPLSNEQY